MLLYISTLMMCCCCRIQLVLYPSYLFSNPPRYAGDVCHQHLIAVLLHLLLVRLMDWALVGAFLLLDVLYNSLLATIAIAGTNSRARRGAGRAEGQGHCKVHQSDWDTGSNRPKTTTGTTRQSGYQRDWTQE